MTEPLYRRRGGGDLAKGAAQAVADTIQKRVADPGELAATICFLLSEEASFIIGSVVVADDGQTAV